MKELKKGAESLPDEAIVELYWKRDERAIEETDRKYRGYLYTIAYNIIHDEPDCEECLNDTYFGTWERIPPIRPHVLSAFLAKIMRNVAVSRYRRNTATKRVPSELLTSLEELDECVGRTPDDELALAELARVLSDFLRSLPRRDEFVFVCRYYYSDRIGEIARMLGLSENTVLRDLARIRGALRRRLEEEGYEI